MNLLLRNESQNFSLRIPNPNEEKNPKKLGLERLWNSNSVGKVEEG